ncbi:uncharacterized protein LOC106737371 [Alligator mississippiensis]|uniref:Mediator of RNA polymerase II transcription subunit 26 n=1 Tax=Alligator mississippiensis TaxID=8496 RepID=A0A151M698_ALLMI|nr:uncharacterized protein LOC106737371 [Alligator mississippiensis]KYO20043.1 hypothetical protein Y1Q_0010638 [Alligator mississippiensis]
MSSADVVTEDSAMATANTGERDRLPDISSSFRNLAFCCVGCFQRRTESNSVKKVTKKKRNKKIPLADKASKQECLETGQDYHEPLHERDHGDALLLHFKPYNKEVKGNLSAVPVDICHNEEKQEQKHLHAVFLNMQYKKKKMKKKQDHFNMLCPSTSLMSPRSESGPYKEEQNYHHAQNWEQLPTRPVHHGTLSLGVTFEEDQQENVIFDGAPYKEEQDYQSVPNKEEQEPKRHVRASSLEVTYEKKQSQMSSESEGASYKEDNYGGVLYKKEPQPMGPESQSMSSLARNLVGEEQVRKENTRSLRIVLPHYEECKKMRQHHQTNLIPVVLCDDKKQQQDAQNQQNIMPQNDRDRELQDGCNPHKLISSCVPHVEEEQQKRQDLLNTTVPCVSQDKGQQQESQNLLPMSHEKEEETKQLEVQEPLSSVSLFVPYEEDEQVEEGENLFTFLCES